MDNDNNIEDKNNDSLEIDKVNKEKAEKKDKNPTNKKSTIINIIFIVVIFVGLFIYMIAVDGIDNIIQLLSEIDYKWVLAGFGFLIINWIFEALTFHLPLKAAYKKQKFGNSFKISMIGLLFNNLTPFASGGQPMQAYEYAKSGHRASNAFSALAIKFIIVQSALVIFSFAVMIIEFNFFIDLLKDYLWIVILSFIVNIIAIVFAILIGVNKKIVEAIIRPIVKFFGKIRILKHPDETLEKLDKSIDNFAKQFSVMKSEKKMVVKTFIIALFQCLSYYAITYAVYRAFGNNEFGFWQIIPAQAVLLLIMTFIPTPGSGGGAEGGFLLIFNSIFKQGTINMSILFWRIYTFYLPIIIGALFLIPVKRKIRNKKTFQK